MFSGHLPALRGGGFFWLLTRLENLCYNGCKMAEHDDLREFMKVLRRALVMIVRYIERRYSLSDEPNK